MSERRRLPDRRLAETFSLEADGQRYVCTVGKFPDGTIGEVFLNNHKANSAADTNARDAAIVFSIAIQCGVDSGVIRAAIGNGPLGTALDIINTAIPTPQGGSR